MRYVKKKKKKKPVKIWAYFILLFRENSENLFRHSAVEKLYLKWLILIELYSTTDKGMFYTIVKVTYSK